VSSIPSIHRKTLLTEWRKLHKEELHNLYSSPNIINQIKSSSVTRERHVPPMGEEIKMYKVLVGKLKRRRPLGRPSRRWEDGIRMDLTENDWGRRVDAVGSG
jgi:hypothetical protein